MFTLSTLAATATSATAATVNPMEHSVEPATTATPATVVAKVATVAVAVGASDEVGAPPLSAVQEAARNEVLARLERHPAVKRVFVTRWEDDSLIVTLAIRGIGIGELMIPAARMQGDNLAAYEQLLEILK